MIRLLLLSAILLTTAQVGLSQDRAPSCWLKYQDYYAGDILINTVRIASPSPTYTYYCNLQWNAGQEGGGYCGMQEHPDGRNFIFSIWDPISSSDAITAPYVHPSTDIESFGGEGTGLKSWNFGIGWETNQWYTNVTRAWDEGTHSFFGYWIYSHADLQWYHLVTMDYPVADIRYASNTGSFIEDWLGNGDNAREVQHRNAWKRRTTDLSWNPLETSILERVSPDPGAVNYIDNYDGGVIDDYYFMRSGGTTSPTTSTSGTTLSLSNASLDPGMDTGALSSMSLNLNDDLLNIDWEVDGSQSPQYSYHIAVYPDATLSGTPLLESEAIVPHERSASLDISSLPTGNTYHLALYITDIFDQVSLTVSESFEYSFGVGIAEPISFLSQEPYPNPFVDQIKVNLRQGAVVTEVRLFDARGRNVRISTVTQADVMTVVCPQYLKNGIYYLELRNQEGLKQTVQLTK